MIIAQKLKQQNIIEYLLYMWQIEDLIRANDFDLDKIQKNVIDKFDVPDDTKQAMRIWYDNLIALMENDGVKERGHIQVLANIVYELTDLHLKLMRSPFHQDYQKAFEEAMPYLNEYLAKVPQNERDKSLIELALEAMYGKWVLRLQGKQISEQTDFALNKISNFLAILAKKYYDMMHDENFTI
jgi:lipopolysaccharide export LptBFGC system permease protein LptF